MTEYIKTIFEYILNISVKIKLEIEIYVVSQIFYMFAAVFYSIKVEQLFTLNFLISPYFNIEIF